MHVVHCWARVLAPARLYFQYHRLILSYKCSLFHYIQVDKPLHKDMKKKQALFQEMDERRHNLECPEVLLKYNKRGSLHHPEALYDPILHEYIVPKEARLIALAIEQDKKNKRQLFEEMSVRKRKNLDERECFCDPLVHVYRANDIDEVDV